MLHTKGVKCRGTVMDFGRRWRRRGPNTDDAVIFCICEEFQQEKADFFSVFDKRKEIKVIIKVKQTNVKHLPE